MAVRPLSGWSKRTRSIGLGAVGILTLSLVGVSSGTAATAASSEPPVIVLEDFSSAQLPDDWQMTGGDWSVQDGQLLGTGGTGRDRITFAETPREFRFETDVTFLDALDDDRWINLLFDYDSAADAGSAVGLRVKTDSSKGVELCTQRAVGDYDCSQSAAPITMGIGSQHHVVVEVHEDAGGVSIDGVQVAANGEWGRDFVGTFGLIVNSSTVAFDNVAITDLTDAPRPLASVGDLKASTIADGITAMWSPPESLGTSPDGDAAALERYEVAIAEKGTAVPDLHWAETTDTTFSETGFTPGEYQVYVRAVNTAGVISAAFAASATISGFTASGLPLQHFGGLWDSGHIQSIAVDQAGGFIYYSFTNKFVKADFDGQIIGSVNNFGSGGMGDGHFGDLVFNPDDGMVYGSLEFDPLYYAAIFDVDKITEMDMNGQESGIIKTVRLAEIAHDFLVDLDGDGEIGPDDPASNDHRFGTAGFDGMAFGPKFGQADGKNYLTLAYGIYARSDRDDNDHQVLVQYDVTDWDQYAQVFDEANLHTEGPEDYDFKAFIYTGNSKWGIQNLTYDAFSERWYFSTYGTAKPDRFPSYNLFAFEADEQPHFGDLVGTGEEGWLIDLADDGLEDPATGIRGWKQTATTGFESLGNGLFFIGEQWKEDGLEGGRVKLYHDTGDTPAPFELVDADDLAVEPGFSSEESVTAVEGTALSHTLVAAGVPAPAYRVTDGALPEGVSLDERSGKVSGSPMTAGTFIVEVTASNQVIADAIQQLTITVSPATTWKSTETYDTGDMVMYDGRQFEAQWWTEGDTPDASATGPWAEIGEIISTDQGEFSAWTNSWIYTGGETVVHEGHIWKARWWTRNQEPGGTNGPWQDLGGA